jgi:hypothetical protein
LPRTPCSKGIMTNTNLMVSVHKELDQSVDAGAVSTLLQVA